MLTASQPTRDIDDPNHAHAHAVRSWHGVFEPMPSCHSPRVLEFAEMAAPSRGDRPCWLSAACVPASRDGPIATTQQCQHASNGASSGPPSQHQRPATACQRLLLGKDRAGRACWATRIASSASLPQSLDRGPPSGDAFSPNFVMR